MWKTTTTHEPDAELNRRLGKLTSSRRNHGDTGYSHPESPLPFTSLVRIPMHYRGYIDDAFLDRLVIVTDHLDDSGYTLTMSQFDDTTRSGFESLAGAFNQWRETAFFGTPLLAIPAPSTIDRGHLDKHLQAITTACRTLRNAQQPPLTPPLTLTVARNIREYTTYTLDKIPAELAELLDNQHHDQAITYLEAHLPSGTCKHGECDDPQAELILPE